MLIEKEVIRRHCINERKKLDPSYVKESTLRVCQALYRYVTSHYPLKTIIAGYYPIHSELDIRDTLKLLHHDGYQTSLPVIEHKSEPLHFHLWKPGDLVLKSRFFSSVYEPPVHTETVIPELLLVPLIAYDQDYFRLGYGSGAYDRTIQFLRSNYTQNIVCIGVGFSTQFYQGFPIEPFDQSLDGIITENGYLGS